MKKSFPLLGLVLGLTLVACGPKANWSWENASADGELQYALLIGQIDHNDSAARTGGIRNALGTRGTQLLNWNAESPVEGKLTLGGKEYKVKEVEHAEQRNTAGATWDQQTATSTVEGWLNKHSKLDFIVSNNDGMAEGAIGASNWISGMPIFGYDSNASTLDYIKEGKIMGTINQNAQAQAAGILMVARNAIDGLTPADAVKKGFSETSSNGYGKISSGFTANTGAGKDQSLLVDNFKITAANVNDYAGIPVAQTADKGVTKGTTASARVWLNTYSASDTFLTSTVKPLFQAYKANLNLEIDVIDGDGNAESSVLDKLATELTKPLAERAKAYVINLVKTTAAASYLSAIKTAYGTNPMPPVVFWNRQPTLESGAVDIPVMHTEGFTHLYYVGFDAIQGGQLQGEMIVDYFKDLAK